MSANSHFVTLVQCIFARAATSWKKCEARFPLALLHNVAIMKNSLPPTQRVNTETLGCSCGLVQYKECVRGFCVAVRALRRKTAVMRIYISDHERGV